MTGNSGKRMLPANPHLGHLRRQAKARLEALRAQNAAAQLADAQFALARDYGFAGWRALIAEAMRRRTAFQEAHGADPPRRIPSPQRLWLARQQNSNPDADMQAGFLGAAAALHIGLFFAALAGMSMLFVGGAPTHMAQAPPMQHIR